jgi:hypothetical protein
MRELETIELIKAQGGRSLSKLKAAQDNASHNAYDLNFFVANVGATVLTYYLVKGFNMATGADAPLHFKVFPEEP